MSKVEGGLRAPERNVIAWKNEDYWNTEKLDEETRRQFDVCHGCRRCFNLCDSFPQLFDIIDESKNEDVESLSSEQFPKVVDACTLCDMCFMTKCPYVPPHEFDIDFPNAGSNTYCMSLGAIGEGTIPNQYGTWGYGRAGWCPGQDVAPFVTDITDHIVIGDENVIDYEACRVVGNSCVSPPTCGSCGYCPEVAFSSYIIIYY